MCLNVTISNIIVQVACVAVQLLVPEIATHVPGKIGFLIELCDFFIKTILIYMYTVEHACVVVNQNVLGPSWVVSREYLIFLTNKLLFYVHK